MNGKEPKDRGEFAVFEVYGKTLHYSKNSLFIFDQDNLLRVRVVKIVAHPSFDRFILFLILVNSAVLALTDWSVIDEDPASSTVGEPSQSGSWRNKLLYKSEPVFTALFTFEFILKVIAQGFCLGPGSYLRNAWNVLDFIVVITALLSNIPEVPTMTAIRVFRVLRPLRSVSALPGLQKLVLGMLRSVPQLVSVVILLAFIFTVFGIFGVQIFGAKQHGRCRLTPHPVTNNFEIGMNYTEYRCLNVSNFDVEDDEPSWTKSSSPWSTPRECWWPLDSEDERLCTVDQYGKHKCHHDRQYMNETEFRWCGSNYDALGNPRFAGGVIEGVEWSAKELTANATYIQSLNWGYTTFDNIFSAVLSIFQAITLEGWSEILYQVKDCSLPILADLFFIVLILWGSFFTLNLLLAVLEANFTKGKEDDKESEEARRRQPTPKPNEETHGNAALEEKVELEQTPFWGTVEEERSNQREFSEAKLDEGGGRNVSRTEEQDGVGKLCKVSGDGDAANFPPWRSALRRLVDAAYFQQLVTVLIILNTVTLAIDHHPLDEEVATYLEAFNFAFTLCFMLEMVLKLVALGPRGYAEDRFNLFDGLIVISSLVELILSPPSFLTGESVGDSNSGGGLSALRTFRVLRVFKLARSWKSMRELLSTLSRTVVDVGNFGLLLILFMFIYSLIGLQFFANRFHFDEDGDSIAIGQEGYYDAQVPRSNFDTLLNAFTSIFVILSGDSWNAVMFDGRRATGWMSVLYFVSLIVLGMMIIMTLFLAILLSNFGDDHRGKEDGEEKEGVEAEKSSIDGDGKGDGKRQRHDNEAGPDYTERPSIMTMANTSQGGPFNSSSQSVSEDGLEGVGRSAPCADSGLAEEAAVDVGSKRGDGDDRSERGDDVANVVGEGLTVRYGRRLSQAGEGLVGYVLSAIRSVQVPDNLDPGWSLFVFGPKNPVRRGCAAVVTNPAFDKVVLILIGISSISLALDNPLLDPDSAMANDLGELEVVMTILFVIEMALKVCADGFLLMPGAYLRNSWNILDFLVVVISVFQLLSGSSGSLQSLKSLRALRALRPLRVINRAPGLKLVLNSLFAAIPDVLNVAAVCFMFFLIFAILGVTYFKGILMSCQGDDFDALSQVVVSFIESPVAWSEMSDQQREWFGPSSNVSEAYEVEFASQCAVINSGWPDSAACCPDWPLSSSEAPTSFQVCECLGLDWGETIPQQFDNVGLALLTFFEMSTISGWSSVTYAAVDATDVDMQPIRDKYPNRVWFFMLFILFGSYLVMNLFVGVIIDNFKEMKSKAEGGSMMTEEQQSWMKTQLIMTRLRPLKRLNPPRYWLGKCCYWLSRHKWFELVVMACIVLNAIIMAMQYFGQGETYTRFLEVINFTFYLIFLFEAVIKLLGLRKAYFTDPWNRFDFFIVIGSTLGLLMVWLTGSSYGSIAMIVRIFRIGRVLRLVRGMESMAQLFQTLLVTLPSLGNVGALLFLMFFIYAAMGVQLFAKVGFEGAVDEQANFQTFWGSMVLLLRLSTGDSWNFFMYDMVADREGCVTDPDYDPDMCGFSDRPDCIPLNGCGSWTIFPYMITFTLTIGYVFMNLFIGVILDGFDEASKENGDIIKQEDFARFARNWEEFDPRATCLMSVHDLPKFLQTLFEPWGFEDHEATDRELRNKIERLTLRVTSDNQVHFQDVLVALSKEVHRALAEKKGANIDLSESYGPKNSGSRGASIEEKEYIFNPFSKREITLEQILAAEYIQRAYRRKREWERSNRGERERGRGTVWASYQRKPRVTESPKDPTTRGSGSYDLKHSMKVDGLIAAEEGAKGSSAVWRTYLVQDDEVGNSTMHRTDSDIWSDFTNAGGSARGASPLPRPEASPSRRRTSGARRIFGDKR